MNHVAAVAQPVVEEPWEPLLVVPKDNSTLVTTLAPLLGLLVVYGVVLVAAFAGRMP